MTTKCNLLMATQEDNFSYRSDVMSILCYLFGPRNPEPIRDGCFVLWIDFVLIPWKNWFSVSTAAIMLGKHTTFASGMLPILKSHQCEGLFTFGTRPRAKLTTAVTVTCVNSYGVLQPWINTVPCRVKWPRFPRNYSWWVLDIGRLYRGEWRSWCNIIWNFWATRCSWGRTSNIWWRAVDN